MRYAIHAKISGFTGKPSMVDALYDSDSKHCMIGKIRGATANKSEHGILIADSRMAGADEFFAETDIEPAIHAYYELKNAGLFFLGDSVMQADPHNGIEFDGVKNGKKEYRILPIITNAQIGTLAVALNVARSQQIDLSISFHQQLNDFMSMMDGFSITV